MKTILNKIEFHYTYILMALSLVLAGCFSNLIVFTSLIIVHELGHAIVGIILNYQLDKIIIYPYGGLTKFTSLINNKISKDLLVSVSGLLSQLLYFGLITILYKMGFLRLYIYKLFTLYNSSMLLFNILPITPLDGSKIVNLILSKYLNYNLANTITIYLSLFSLIILLLSNIYEKNYSFILVIGILITNIYKSYQNLSSLYNRFLLERYLYNIHYPKIRLVTDISKLYKNKTHYFLQNGKIISEKTVLSHFFHKKS